MMSSASVTALIYNFADACRALIPALDRANVPWQEGKQYDNWERIEDPLFKSLVAEPCEFQAQAFGVTARFPNYGFRQEDGSANARISVSENEGKNSWRYVRLFTLHQPFDAVECVQGSEVRHIPLTAAQFQFIVASEDDERSWTEVRLDL
jgi:hypothetical protein